MSSPNIFVFLFVGLLISSPALACGFEAKGVTKDNIKQIEAALKAITPLVEVRLSDQSIHFSSKEEVTLSQVEVALKEAGILGVNVQPITH